MAEAGLGWTGFRQFSWRILGRPWLWIALNTTDAALCSGCKHEDTGDFGSGGIPSINNHAETPFMKEYFAFCLLNLRHSWWLARSFSFGSWKAALKSAFITSGALLFLFYSIKDTEMARDQAVQAGATVFGGLMLLLLSFLTCCVFVSPYRLWSEAKRALPPAGHVSIDPLELQNLREEASRSVRQSEAVAKCLRLQRLSESIEPITLALDRASTELRTRLTKTPMIHMGSTDSWFQYHASNKRVLTEVRRRIAEETKGLFEEEFPDLEATPQFNENSALINPPDVDHIADEAWKQEYRREWEKVQRTEHLLRILPEKIAAKLSVENKIVEALGQKSVLAHSIQRI
ncbi:hypothetical protein GFL80_25760 [Rhizobium leguminosarum bv. viciae]|uniref:hypothetical protein n=1 Tax=Rhizobium leguminosarum TaxID=384 RepID=UPI001441C624|nr:hypothetical protein [Rhizobium leguminosarum]NKK87568.1 hypothetical protein [Rhizobium leguminosarum bv. viciae]